VKYAICNNQKLSAKQPQPVKGGDIALNGSPSQSYGASPAVWDHTVLPATRHR